MKIIDLLNKIADGEDFPKVIKIDYITYKWNKSENKYCRQDADYVSLSFGTNNLNDEVEIIEEQQDIDIQSIEEIEPAMNGNACVIDTKTWTLNQVIRAVKQLDKKIKEKG